MTAIELIESLERQGAVLSLLPGGGFNVKPTPSNEVLSLIREHKAGVLQELELREIREVYGCFAKLLPLVAEGSEHYNRLTEAYDASPADGSYPFNLAVCIVETFRRLDPGYDDYLLTSRYRKAA